MRAVFLYSMGQLNKHKEGLQRERDKLLGEMVFLHEKIEELESERDDLRIKITTATETAEEAQKQMEV